MEPIAFYFPDENLLRKYHHVKTVEVPLADMDVDVEDHENVDDEIVSVEIPKDLRDDPTELCTLLENSLRVKKEAWLVVAVAYALQDKFEQALETVKSAFQSQQVSEAGNFQKFPFHLFLGWLHLRRARVAQNKAEADSCFQLAAQEIDTALSINPVSNEALLARAVLFGYTNPSNLDELAAMYDKILKNDTNNAYALLGKAKALCRKGQYNLALKLFQQVLILNPTLKPDSRIGIGLCFWNLKDVHTAVRAWQRSAELFPTSLASKLLFSIVEFHHAFTESLTDSEFVEKYSSAVSIIAELYNSSKLNQQNPYVISILASYLYSKGDYKVLIQILDSFVSQNDLLDSLPSKAVSDLYFWLARCYYTVASLSKDKMSEIVTETSSDALYTKSQKLISLSLRFDKNNLYSKVLLGQIQYLKKNINDAILTFETLLKAQENSGSFESNKNKLVEVNYMLGLLYHEKVFSGPKKQFKSKESAENVEKSLNYLNRYLKLCAQLKESVFVNGYLSLAKNYEYQNKLDSVLGNLEKAAEVLQNSGVISPEIVNNIGVFQFLKNNVVSAETFFKLAKDNNSSEESKVTLEYNLSRVAECNIVSNGFKGSETTEKLEDLYGNVLQIAPNYLYAKLRLFHALACDPLYTADESKLNNLDNDLRQLMESRPGNMEVRAFYGWFIKKFNRKLHSLAQKEGSSNNAEVELYKETLTKFDSHDGHSLISLGNVYLVLARESKEPAKKNSYFVKAAQLYQKALSVNSNNLFAAQGLAIIFSEMKRTDLAVEIFKKIRDSLNDVSIFLNLGHVLIETHDYSKAIECYEIAVKRFGGGAEDTEILGNLELEDVFDGEFVKKYADDLNILTTNSRYFTLLGKAWLLRGINDNSLAALQTSLQFSKRAYVIASVQQLSNEELHKNLIPALKFNIAYVHFQIAEYMRKESKNKKSSEEISKTIAGLDVAIKLLEELAELPNAPYSPESLKQRANMGSNTVRNLLTTELEAQKAYEKKYSERIAEGQKLREQEKERILEEQRRNAENEEKVKAKLREEREELQKTALQWAEELAEKNRLAEAAEKAKKTKKVDEDGFVLEDEKSSDEEQGQEEAKDAKKDKKKRKKRLRPASESANKKSKKYKSADIIDDSDEEANYTD